jgi:hypothetical protein
MTTKKMKDCVFSVCIESRKAVMKLNVNYHNLVDLDEI